MIDINFTKRMVIKPQHNVHDIHIYLLKNVDIYLFIYLFIYLSLAPLCANAQQSYCRHADVHRLSVRLSPVRSSPHEGWKLLHRHP